MGHHMPKLGKNQRLAGQLTGFFAAGHAEDHGAADNAGCCAGEDGRGIDLFVAELGEDGPECGHLLGKQGFDGFDGDICGRDAGAAGDQQGLKAVVADGP